MVYKKTPSLVIRNGITVFVSFCGFSIQVLNLDKIP